MRRSPGEAYVLDLLIRKRSGRQRGWLAVSTGLSERTIDGINLDESFREQPFKSKFDRHVSVNLVHSLDFRKRWTLNSRIAYASGQPYTQVFGTGEIALPSGLRRSFQEKGDLNAVRLPSYQRLDIAVRRRFEFDGWGMNAYLQIINATNHKNLFNYFWSDGTTHTQKPGKRRNISMLPLLPSIGVDFNF